jgi:GMP synthase (glutamine-hydrolysing)
MKSTAKVLILDFGSQVTQLIARRIREIGIYCEIQAFYKPIVDPNNEIKAVILSGSPASVREENYPNVDINSICNQYPIFGICYGAQLIANELGGKVLPSSKREYGKTLLEITQNDPIWKDIPNQSQVWMSHSDTISEVSKDFTVIAQSNNIAIAAYKKVDAIFPLYAVQFHPEVIHSTFGSKLLENFLLQICNLEKNWTPDSFVQESIDSIRNQVGEDHVLLALSGGVDSSVAAAIMRRAIGDRLHCFFIDNGLLRKDEFQNVLNTYHQFGIEVDGVDASEEFLSQLQGISDPETKRKIIGKVFIDVFEREAKKYKEVSWLCQGTIYPDVIESVSVYGPAAKIKSHHNVGGLPEKLNLKIIEPLRLLFKDEVRRVGQSLQLPNEILSRHPFPGPGLAIRILGDITREKVNLLQEADAIYMKVLKEQNLYDSIWQAGAILLPIQSVGVMGDERTYERVLALRAVSSVDGMTAEFSKIPHDVLSVISNTIINQVKGINRVVYDISSKPPATIEWE